MKHLLSFVLAAAAAAWTSLPAPPPPRLPDLGHEIFYATLEGLYRDGVTDATVDRILATDDGGAFLHFVPGCPTCIYVLEALRHYRARPDFVSFKMVDDTWGDGLPKGVRAKFASASQKVRLDALHGLVARWIDERMDRLRLTDKERARWEGELQARAKKGMGLLERYREDGRMAHWGDSRCPSCDGAVDGAQCPPPKKPDGK